MRRSRLVSHCGSFVKVRLNAAIAKSFAALKFKFFVVDTVGCRSYKPGHTARRPLSARLRAPEAPHFRVERISEKKSGVPLRRLPGLLGRGSRKAAGLFDR